MDKEMEKFCNDLLLSVKQIQAGKAARKTKIQVSAAARNRNHLQMSQHAPDCLANISAGTAQT